MEWRSLFPDNVYAGGQILYQNGDVTELRDVPADVYENQITAVVRGVDTFNVKINYDKEGVRAVGCSCPFSGGVGICKHSAATLIAWENVSAKAASDSRIVDDSSTDADAIYEFEAPKAEVAEKTEIAVDTTKPSEFVNSSNFKFLMAYWPDMAEIGATAETYLFTDSTACIFKLGLLGERVVNEIVKAEKLNIPNEETQANKIKVLKREGLIPKNIDDILFALRKARNDAVHEGKSTFENADTLLKMTFNLCEWFMEVYGDWSYEPQSFVEPEKKDESSELADKLKEQELRINALIDQITEIKTKASEASKEDRLQKAEEVSENIVLSENENEYLLKEQVRLDINALPVMNYALQQNGVPIVKSIAIENKSEQSLENVELRISSEPEICVPFTKHIELVPGLTSFELLDIDLELNGEFLSGITECIKGVLTYELAVDDEVFYSEKGGLTALAFDEWHGYMYYPEILSSFVTPNAPGVTKIITKASEYLGKWTEYPSLDAYQSGDANRVLNMVAAVYEAIKSENIVYCVPPASFEREGQRVRLCDTIMDQKLATCLDITLLFASCLEQIGIHSILLLKKGHIFAGAWLENNTFTESVQDDVSLVTKRYADGLNEIVVFECTAAESGKNCSFDDAVKIAKREMLDIGNFEIVLDVARARLSGVKPIPQRIKTEEGWRVVKENDNYSAQAPSSIYGAVDINAGEETPKTRIDRWERKLLDLGLRNRLINMSLSKGMIPIVASSLDELENALASGSDFTIVSRPVDWHLSGGFSFDTAHELGSYSELIKSEFKSKRLRSLFSEAELTKATKELYRASKLSIEENGANTLYLALGLLRWFETPRSTKPRYAPLILLPIEMVRKSLSQGYVIRLRDDEPQMNITILEKLKQDFKLNITGLDPLPEDEQGIDTRKVFTIIRKAIMNQDRWDVLESAYLGIFSFTQFVMWNDLKNRTADLAKNKVVKSLMEGKLAWTADEMELGERVSEDDVFLPIPADASQLFAIESAAKGQSFVLHGPPGTGKSQTITALIANALAQGKTVLFVAEKMAALQVVQSRLEKIGIGDFCLELHSNKSKKKDVLEQLRKASEVTKKQTAESYKAKADQIAKIRKELDEYVSMLHETRTCGVSLFELINEYEANATDVELEHYDKAFLSEMTREKIDELDILVQRLIAAAKAVGHPHNHPLDMIGCRTYTQQMRVDMPEITKAHLDCVSDLIVKRNAAIAILGENYSSYDDLSRLNAICIELIKWNSFPEKWAQAENPSLYFEQVKEMASHYLKKGTAEKALLGSWKEDILSLDGNGLLNEYQVANAKWALPKMLNINNISKRLVIYSKTAKVNKAELGNDLLNLVTYQKELEAGKSMLAQYGSDLGSFYAGDATDWGNIINMAEGAKASADALDGIKDGRKIRTQFAGRADIIGVFSAYVESYARFIEKYESFRDLFGIKSSNEVVGWLEAQNDLCNTINSNFDSIKEWINWNDIAYTAIQAGLVPVVLGYKKGLSHDEAYRAYKHSICKDLAVKLIDETPVLNKFSGSVFNEKIDQFRRMDAELINLTQKEIYCRLAAQVPNFAREAAQSSELGIIQRAIRSNGRGISIRRLFEQIPNMLPRLCPCMLMSPISAAQYLDPKSSLFDLVVFDEASQLPTCKAVGALARGKDSIIVGDPKQMPPTSFFSSSKVDEEEIELEDLESILDDCLGINMPQTHLLWHYRSKHESLIAFSNSQFYDNKLFTFPSVNDRERKVNLVHINGTFDRGKTRQNRAEAEAVVKEIVRRFNDLSLRNQSIGVVTFNVMQQNLIDDLLSAECAINQELEAWVYKETEPLFIKNLENVQGDERDVILFSVGYGPDEYGKVSLNFGPLNRDGGWRRLNVAVSRARYEMVVFATLTPEDIDSNRTGAQGVIALKNFLSYAAGQKLINNEDVILGRDANDSKGIVKKICDVLKAHGYDTDTDIGNSENRIDIGVIDPKNPERYILGILMDGQGYGTAKTTRDREISQISVLNTLGWNIIRIWTMDWWDNSKKELNRIFEQLEKIEKGEAIVINDEPIPNEFKEEEEFFTKVNELVDAPPQSERVVSGYKQVALEITPVSADDFANYSYGSMIEKKITRTIDFEAPILESVVVRRVAQSFGFARAGSRIQAKIVSRLNYSRYKTTYQNNEKVYWNNDQNPNMYYGIRANSEGDGKRDIREVPSEEIRNAIGLVLHEQIGLNQADLVREAAKLLNYTRMGTNVVTVLEESIADTKSKGFIELGSNDCWTLTDTGKWWAKEIVKAIGRD